MRHWVPILLVAWGLGAVAAPVVVVDDRGHALTLAAPPQRVVTLAPALTEIVCALHACGRLVATDRHSNWPAAVAALPKLGGLEDTRIEKLVALRPDLVLVAASARALGRLEALGLPVMVLEPKSLADTQRIIDTLALALGEPASGPALWQSLQGRLARAAARVPPGLRGMKVYFEVGSEPYAAGEGSFVGELLGRLGLGNVVSRSMGPFPQLNPEFVVRAHPDLVMASERALADMPNRPGWRSMAALQSGRVCGFGLGAWDALVRPGPRLAEGAEHIADCLGRLPALPIVPALPALAQSPTATIVGR
jgi:iron complex transport system substrate-binding protein